MAARNIFKKILDAAAKEGIESTSKNSVAWFKENIRKLNKRKIDTAKLIKDSNTPGKRIASLSVMRPGSMMMWAYDAKHKATLPYWDKFPLAIVIDVDPDYGVDGGGGFLALNLHYIAPKMRAIIIAKMLELTTNKKFDDTTRFVMTYEMLKSASKYSILKPTLKRYLWKQVKSKFVVIPPENWVSAVFLPLQKFQGASAQRVWADSAKKSK